MSANTILASEFDITRLVVSKHQKDKAGGGSVRVLYRYNDDEEPSRLIVQTPRMRAPFGLNSNEKFAKENDLLKWTLQLSFDGEDRNKKIQKFKQFLETFDEHFIKLGIENSEEWINDDEPDLKSVKKAYKGTLKKFKIKKDKPDVVYPDNFNVSVSWDYEKDRPQSNIEFFDEQGEPTEWTNISPGCEMVVLFSINAIWCKPGIGSYGPSVKIVQAQIFKPKKIKGFNIKYDADEDSDQESDGLQAVDAEQDPEENGEESEYEEEEED